MGVVLAASGLLAAGCEREREDEETWQAISLAFPARGQVPPMYTCEGANVSPPLAWEPPPARTQSIALIMHDPTAPGGDFAHWVLYNIPPAVTNIEAAVPPQARFPNGATHGANGSGTLGYSGPCLQPGGSSRYVFDIYALDSVLDLPPGATAAQLKDAIKGHTIARAQVVGRSRRDRQAAPGGAGQEAPAAPRTGAPASTGGAVQGTPRAGAGPSTGSAAQPTARVPVAPSSGGR